MKKSIATGIIVLSIFISIVILHRTSVEFDLGFLMLTVMVGSVLYIIAEIIIGSGEEDNNSVDKQINNLEKKVLGETEKEEVERVGKETFLEKYLLKFYKKPFDYSGRIGRKEFFIFSILSFLTILISYALLAFCVYAFVPKDISEGDILIRSMVFLVPFSLFVIGTFFAILKAKAKRLHDMGVSAWWLILVVLFSFLGTFVLMIVRGSWKNNQWGKSSVKKKDVLILKLFETIGKRTFSLIFNKFFISLAIAVIVISVVISNNNESSYYEKQRLRDQIYKDVYDDVKADLEAERRNRYYNY